MMKRFLSMIAVLMLMLAAIVPAGMAEEVQEYSPDPFEEITAEFLQAKAVEPYTIALKPARVTGWVNMRWAPSKQAPVMSNFPAKTQMTVLKETPNWLQVEYAATGDVGYINRAYAVHPDDVKTEKELNPTVAENGKTNIGVIDINGAFSLQCKMAEGYSIEPLKSTSDQMIARVRKLLSNFDSEKFYTGTPNERLNCLNLAVEFIQNRKETEQTFMEISKKLKASYSICFSSGELKKTEIEQAQFFLAIRSIIYKQTKGDAPDAEIMNITVEKMVQDAINCTGIENIINENKLVNLFGEDFSRELAKVKMPITKFNALLKLLRKTVQDYERENKIKSMEFVKRLRKIVDDYNHRDNLVFANSVVSDFVDELSDKLLIILKDLEREKNSLSNLRITIEEKVFFDILVQVRNEHCFDYPDENCLTLAKAIKKLVDSQSKFADWKNRIDIKNELSMKLTILLYENNYPPEWKKEIFDKLLAQYFH